jgi:hypothetical protein
MLYHATIRTIVISSLNGLRISTAKRNNDKDAFKRGRLCPSFFFTLDVEESSLSLPRPSPSGY